MMSMSLVICLLASVFTGASAAASCRSDNQCEGKVGEVCLQRFYGCDSGQCLCPEGQDKDNHGICRRRKLGDETCTSNDVCSGGMRCQDARCRCDGDLSPDRSFCLRHNQRLIGDTCNGDSLCLQQIGSRYTRNDVTCKDGHCRCMPGFKETTRKCRKWDIGEYGCREHDQCHGGALCIDNRCQCPSGYNTGASGTKCTKSNAIVDLMVGQQCNEVHEQKYCGENLICHTCDGVSLCLESRDSPQEAFSTSSQTTPQRSRLLCTSLVVSLYMYFHFHRR